MRRIAAPPRAGIELRIFGYFVLPLLLILVSLLGLLVRSFPGPGDLEILELAVDQPVHVAADRIHRAPDGTWSAQGLSLVADARAAAATFTLHGGSARADGRGPRHDRPRPARRRAPAPRARRDASRPRDGDRRRARARTRSTPSTSTTPRAASSRRRRSGSSPGRAPSAPRLAAVDFVRAKAHLAFDEALRRRLLEPRVQRRELRQGRGAAGARARGLAARRPLRLPRARDRRAAAARTRGSCSTTTACRSLLGLKTILPDVFQRAFRFRRSRQRVVS